MEAQGNRVLHTERGWLVQWEVTGNMKGKGAYAQANRVHVQMRYTCVNMHAYGKIHQLGSRVMLG